MRRLLLVIACLSLIAMPATAQTADEIVAKYIKTIGGAEKIQAIKTLRRSGKFIGGGGFEATVLEENKRSNMVRQEFSLQGMTAVNAYDGKTGWKIEPWQGKKDPESLGEEEMMQIVEDSDFDGPLVNYQVSRRCQRLRRLAGPGTASAKYRTAKEAPGNDHRAHARRMGKARR